MTVSATFLRATPYRMFYAIAHDGNPGDTLVITNAELQAAMGAHPVLKEVLNTSVADDAAAVLLMAAGGRAVTRITPGTAAAGWAMDWLADGGNLPELEIEGETGIVNDGLIEIEVLHSYTR
jgi:hypothetical protein